jgi:hypothetical protein
LCGRFWKLTIAEDKDGDEDEVFGGRGGGGGGGGELPAVDGTSGASCFHRGRRSGEQKGTIPCFAIATTHLRWFFVLFSKRRAILFIFHHISGFTKHFILS